MVKSEKISATVNAVCTEITPKHSANLTLNIKHESPDPYEIVVLERICNRAINNVMESLLDLD